MAHVVLLGDSILDNGAYTRGGPDVVAQVRGLLRPTDKATLLALDGATTSGIAAQAARIPRDATHLVLSIGGNDALGQTGILDQRVASMRESLAMLADIAARFEKAYRAAVDRCLRHRLPLALCTIYNGSFPDRDFQQAASTALTVFNDAILRVAFAHKLGVIDLRLLFDEARDYANPIEPSSAGGIKIARAVLRWVSESAFDRNASRVVAGS